MPSILNANVSSIPEVGIDKNNVFLFTWALTVKMKLKLKCDL